jgi:hypothetical protein
MPNPDPDQLPLPQRIGGETVKAQGLSEIDIVVSTAHALELDAPIIHYRIVGDRIELWTIHGGPYTYQPPAPPAPQAQAAPAPAAKKTVRKKKP